MRLKFKNDFLNQLLNVKLTSDLFFRLLIFYLICFSIYEFPYLKAMYSPDGMIYSIGKNWTWWVLPLKSFYNIHSLAWVYFLKTIELLLFFLVLKRRFMALNFILLWIISFIFMQFNNDAQHPPLPYIGWSYIALAVYFFETKSKFFMPQKRHFFYAAVVIGFSYTRSGQLKYLDSIWRSGEAFSFILEKYNSVRPFWTTNHRLLPREISIALNYLTLVVQLTAFFAAFHPITRAISSLALIIMHFFAFIFFNLTQVSLGMICIHLLWIDLNGLKLVIKYISGLRLTITN